MYEITHWTFIPLFCRFPQVVESCHPHLGKHGISLENIENMENIEKTENINKMT